MNTVLIALQDRGLVQRSARSGAGRVLPATLTSDGRRIVNRAEIASDAVEAEMTADLTPTQHAQLRALLDTCSRRLEQAARQIIAKRTEADAARQATDERAQRLRATPEEPTPARDPRRDDPQLGR